MHKNKLLLTTALAGSLIASAAQAEIKGDIETVFAFGSDERAGTNKTGSDTRIGSEMNLSYGKKHDLDNGAYFSVSGKLEVDDAQGEQADHEYEIQYGVENFYIGAGSDSGAANLAATVLPLVGGEYPGTAAAQIGPKGSKFTDLMGTTGSSGSAGKEANDKAHISVNAKVAGGVAGITYAPSTSEQDDDTDNVDDADGGSRIQFAYVGSPVEGLKVVLGQTTDSGANNSTAGSEYENQKIGVSYNFGQFTVAAERQTQETDNDSVDMTGTGYEVAYSVSDNMTFGVALSKTSDDKTASAVDEDIKSVSIGYSLGALGITASYVDVTDADNVSGNDQKGIFIRTKTKF